MKKKVWIDANKISMIHQQPTKKLRNIEKSMQVVPKFDKTDTKINHKKRK